MSAAFLLVSGFAGLKTASAQTFLINSNQSSITISGTVLGTQIMSQGPSSLTAKVGGTLEAAVAGSSIEFVGQSQIHVNNSGTWQPKADGTAGSEPANYGAMGTTILGSGVAALRDVLLDLTNGSIAINNGQFDSSSLTLFFPTQATSTFAYNVSGLLSQHGVELLTGYATNKVTTMGTINGPAGQQTITIPVNATFVFSLVSAGDTVVTLKGQLVATQAAQVPPLVIQSFTVQNQIIALQWQGSAGQQFKVLSSSDFNTWQTNLINAAFANGIYTWTAPATNPIQFLRLAR
ncbi:MAG TPA: hypothetical protein VL361_11560 [Candidatus Limnocylindrales bacterium]|nr:hypothetical protein [Candidatus Limnocylindrales bacterium]